MTTTRTTVRRMRRRPNVAMALHQVEVRRTRRISPRMVRITLAGPSLLEFRDDGPDQSCKLFLPRGVGAPPVPAGADWYSVWLSMPERVRPVMRTYTVRDSRPDLSEVDIDFVLHGCGGPASQWAARARAGDRVALWGPRSEYAPSPAADWQLLIGDATALPAIGGIVAALPVGTRASVFVEVDSPAEEQTFPTCADVMVTWIYLDEGSFGPGSALLEAVRTAVLPCGRVSTWVAGESTLVRSVRRHLLSERGYPLTDVQCTGYWRVGSPLDPG